MTVLARLWILRFAIDKVNDGVPACLFTGRDEDTTRRVTLCSTITLSPDDGGLEKPVECGLGAMRDWFPLFLQRLHGVMDLLQETMPLGVGAPATASLTAAFSACWS